MFTLATLKSYHVTYRHNGEKLRIPDLIKETKEALNVTEEEIIPVFDKWSESEYTKINNILVDIEYEVHTMRRDPNQVYEEYKTRIESINRMLEKG